MVDDEELNIRVVAEYLKSDGHRDLVYTTDPVQAIALIIKEQPDAVLLDIRMPEMSGLEVLRLIRSNESLVHMPVVILTSETGNDTKMEALERGATDFLQKPVHSGELLARLHKILLAKAYQDSLKLQSETLEAAVRRRTHELEASRRDVIHCLARAAEYRDDDTGHHVVRVGRYARIVGEELGLDPRTLDDLEQAAKLHDVGKIGIPDEVLLKPGKLTDEEFDAIRRHCGFGKQIIEPLAATESKYLQDHVSFGAQIMDAGDSPLLHMAKRIALTHHERWDGTGYPLGLAGEDIPLEGRITAVADVFDALSSRRPYKPPFAIDKCLEIMREGRGTHFDPRVLDAFMARRADVVRIQIEYANEE
jgi:putative two-component system response regulator